MHQLLAQLCFLVLIYGSTTRLGSQDDAVQTLTDHFCPRIEPFTCDGNTTGVEFSACCSGCSCDESCILYDNCCYTNWTSDEANPHAIVRCLPTNTKRNPTRALTMMYKFVVKQPPNGCIAPGSCELPEKRIPWKTFGPIYSDKTKKNYVTEDCAKCHGINDGLHWKSVISLNSVFSYNLDDMLEVLMSGDSDRLYVEFEHPVEGHDTYNEICSNNVVNQCNVVRSQKEKFLDAMEQLFPDVILGTDEMEDMCLNGPSTNFFFNSASYKNIFCAFCSYVLPTGQCSKLNSKFGSEVSLIKMLDFNMLTINPSTSKVSSTEENVQRACENVHQLETSCRSIFCPHLQRRATNGECRFAARRWNVQGLLVMLRLYITTTHHGDINISQTFPNLTDSDIKQLFYDRIPWDKDWYLVNIGMRFHSTNETGTMEFMIHMKNDISHIEPQGIIDSIKVSLQQIWYVQTSIGLLGLQQDFLQYGGGIAGKMQTPHGLFVQPQIFMSNGHIPRDVQEAGSEIKTSFENILLSRPGWYVLAYKNLQQTRFPPLIITKMFYCQQIELEMKEFKLLIGGKLLWSNSSQKFFFNGEFSVGILNEQSERKVRMCIEDTDLAIINVNGFSVTGSLGTTVLCIIFVGILI